MENIQLQYPAWYILLCILAGLSFAMLLYYRDKRFRERSPWLNTVLGTLRFLSVTLICFLLLSPLIKSVISETQKPTVVVARDQSESITEAMDSNALVGFLQQMDQLADDLAEKYNVVRLGFGDEVTQNPADTFSDKITDISAALEYIDEQYGDQNLGAVILASDGIYNKGSNPLYQQTQFQAPLYTVALGDTSIKRDLAIKRIFHNKIAYLGDRFSVQADIQGYNMPETQTVLRVYRWADNEWKQVDKRTINIDKPSFFRSEEFILEADKAGVQRFSFRLLPVQGEENTVNNRKDIFIDVLDARQKILILGEAPHPDLAAFRQSIERNKNYEVEVSTADKLKSDVRDYDLLILHQLPSPQHNLSAFIQTAREDNIPIWFIVGQETNIARLNTVQDALSINPQGPGMNDVQPMVNPGFSAFTLDDKIRGELPHFVPLSAPFAEFEPGPAAQTLLNQKIGNVETEYPLLVYTEQGGQRQAVLAAEGFWRWRLYDYLQHESHEITEKLVSKSIQYLSVKEDKRRFRVNIEKNIFDENEPITFSAELYNAAYELINSDDVSLIITDEEGKEYDYTFDRRGDGYELNAGYFPVGNYRFQARVFTNGQELTYQGQFSVQPIQLELYETTADHRLLALLSEKYGADRLYPSGLSALSDQLLNSENIKPVIYQSVRTRSIIHLRWICFLIAAFLCAEWFVRRYYGSY